MFSRLNVLFDRSLVVIFLLILAVSIPMPAAAAEKDQSRWDKHYDIEGFLFGSKPIRFLKDNIHLLPKGRALDLAMGEGRNGIYMATQGFDVLGLDISPVGLNKAHQLAEHHKVKIETRVVDLENYQLEKNAYDVIICTYYMQRDLFDQMKESLKPGGMALVETYNIDYLRYARFSRKYLLENNELLKIFKDFKIIRYQAYDDGKEAYSSIIVQKP
ncbi:MAG TPA: class I SAM-dependent methyltransferase [Nitrospinaceae bacterium]|jgi:2-polyprenyl-3-methyl-5-hydroxy-6-metoxy-1,4-benzoquinol methylase|nr:class I SAM-dependent methyltransferase [Nitrospinaceae bacterium]|tara:strand:- start:5769 stop:6416 length:648 start_codon:yes stop_codon:yes gene_type:complete